MQTRTWNCSWMLVEQFLSDLGSEWAAFHVPPSYWELFMAHIYFLLLFPPHHCVVKGILTFHLKIIREILCTVLVGAVQAVQTLLECSSVPPPSGVPARYFAGGSHCCGRGCRSLGVPPPWPLQFKDWLSNLNQMCEAYSMSVCAWGLLCRLWHMQEHIYKKLKVFYRLWPASQLQIHTSFYQFCCSPIPIHAQT